MSVLRDILLEKRVVVCVGSGGVGKTTAAASLALWAAAQGRRVLVLTIDPARRLANALGMAELGNLETQVPPARLAAAGVPTRGELWAMMLDMKRSWDDLIVKHAPPGRRDAILSSRFYQQLSTALAGSQEYVAMEKLVELRQQRDYDLIVLDTPPTAHALDFLDAPNRVLDFFGNDRMRWMLSPAMRAGRVGLKMFNLTGGYFVRTISRLTGLELLEELAEFLTMLAPMYGVFKDRAAEVKMILGSSDTSFLLVCSPNPLTVDEAISFHTLLVQDAMPVGAVIANRVNVIPARLEDLDPAALDALAARIDAAAARGAAPARERIVEAISDAQMLADLDSAELVRLAERCAPTPVVRVPRFEQEVVDVAGLWALDQHLFEEPASSTAASAAAAPARQLPGLDY